MRWKFWYFFCWKLQFDWELFFFFCSIYCQVSIWRDFWELFLIFFIDFVNSVLLKCFCRFSKKNRIKLFKFLNLGSQISMIRDFLGNDIFCSLNRFLNWLYWGFLISSIFNIFLCLCFKFFLWELCFCKNLG